MTSERLHDIRVPPLSQTMDTLVLVEWVKQVGDPVTKGETLFIVETDKANLDVEATATGILRSISAQPGDEIKVRSVIGQILEAGDSSNLAPISTAEPSSGPAPESTQAHQVVKPGESQPSGRIFASPRARQLIQAKGLSLEKIHGSGPQGMIVERDVVAYLKNEPVRPRATPLAQRIAQANAIDLTSLTPGKSGIISKSTVEAALQQTPAIGGTPVRQDTPVAADILPDAPPAAPTPLPEHQSMKLSPTRRTIARRMLESHTTTAPVTYLREVDATRLVELRTRLLEQLPAETPRPSYTDLLINIVCRVLIQHPQLNATFDGEQIELYTHVHLAVAVDTERGLVAPVLRQANKFGVAELTRLRSNLVAKAQAGELTPDDLSGGTFTLSNLGMLGIDSFTPLINPPQVAILGIGRIRQAPGVYKGKLRLRSWMTLALTCDHRVVDGGPAARFLSNLADLTENPDQIWL